VTSFWLVVILLALLVGGRTIAGTVIDFNWWREIGQLPVWYAQLSYSLIPGLVAGLAAAVILWVSLARGFKFGGLGLGSMPQIARMVNLGALAAGFLLAAVTIEPWTVMLYLGGRTLGASSGDWQDPVFGKPLAFYLFSLPFYRTVFGYLFGLLVLAGVAYWGAARFSSLRRAFHEAREAGAANFRLESLGFEQGLESGFLRAAAAAALLALAVRAWLGRFTLLLSDHSFLVGVDYVDEHIRLPLIWLFIAACVAGAALVVAGRWRWVPFLAIVPVLQGVVPWAVATLHVRPNEISLERPYIERHIQATRRAFGLSIDSKEQEYTTRPEARVDVTRNKLLLDNVRLWDWRAFHDTVTQIQSLRPYYTFADSDVDRYEIDGQLRQVMITPRELDIRQLPDARKRWINPHFIYTHGYGVVMAEASRITADGLPHLFVQDAPPKIKTSHLKITRPEIYYGETTHEPVYVRSAQSEFSYPSGNDSVFTKYEGSGGFPISSWFLRFMAAVRDGDGNILLTSLVTPETRMMIHRDVRERLQAVAGFLHWDADPYLVLNEEGRLIWVADGYTMSQSHPYSQSIVMDNQRTNYIRNSVKATVDAYHGTMKLYVFDDTDPILRAYRGLFPLLFEPAANMPAGLRPHLRYPEALFSAQAEVYRIYHMQDPQAFYNKEDVWDLGRSAGGQRGRQQPHEPVYVVTTVPGETKPEFVLLTAFTPRNKDNLIGLMMARCDGEALGELRFLHLSKQALVFGPRQIEARIDQDPEIAKDLTLWSQKGSEVLRGQMLVLPVDDTILYVEPIYIQAAEGRMPQLKKVVLAVGNDMIYRNTYEEAVQALAGLGSGAPPPKTATSEVSTTAVPPVVQSDGKLAEVRQRLRRYKDLWSQGKYAEAGRELEAVEAVVGR